MPNQYTYMAGLTSRQKQLYDLVYDRITEHGICPSYEELATDLGIVKSGVVRIVDSLCEKGYLKRSGRARGLILCKVCCPHCGASLADEPQEEEKAA